ncbi:hypothetical protein HTZ85_25455 [Escherichia coli]|nr:hypothetical protein [Escherichia coli]
MREGKTMSLQMLREHMTLEGMAKLYCRGLDDQWPEEAIAPLRNYLQDVPRFRPVAGQDTISLDGRTQKTTCLSLRAVF